MKAVIFFPLAQRGVSTTSGSTTAQRNICFDVPSFQERKYQRNFGETVMHDALLRQAVREAIPAFESVRYTK